MPDPVIKSNDLGILHIPPANNTDARVPTAEEISANTQLLIRNIKLAARQQAGVTNRPQFGVSPGLGIVLPANLGVFYPNHPNLKTLGVSVPLTMPGLGNTIDQISRYDYVGLVAMACEVTAQTDPDINFSFRWRRQDSQIQTLVKENTRRLRTFWAVIVSPTTPATATAIETALPTVDGSKILSVSKTPVGSALGAMRIYPLDPNFVDQRDYKVFPGTIEVAQLCRVWRVQNTIQNGYHWGRNGEQDFLADYHLQPTYHYVGVGSEDYEMRGKDAFRRLMTGQPLLNAPWKDRAVLNLINGQVTSNLNAPGIPVSSPNGSVGLANGQRITFTNEPRTEYRYCVRVQSINQGGVAEVVTPFAVASPLGSRVAADPSNHEIWDINGNPIGNEGTYSGLGDTGALVWRCSNTAVITPGDFVYVQMGIEYPAGSGFPFAGEIEAVYRNGLPLNPANVREATLNDIEAYTAPVGGDQYLVVMGKERAALHYIYAHDTVTSTPTGVVRIPDGSTGVIAFISGPNAPTGRINRPVLAGLSPNTTYQILHYHSPSASTQWQFQISYPKYPSVSGGASLLNGSRVVTPFEVFAHTQGGGNSVFQSEGAIRYEPVGMRLPYNSDPNALRPYATNTKPSYLNEPDPGALAFRSTQLLGGQGLTALRPGVPLTANAAGGAQSQGLSVALTSNNTPVGIQKNPLASQRSYQLVGGCVVEKSGQYHLLVVSVLEGDPAAISYVAFDASAPHFAGIDLFPLW